MERIHHLICAIFLLGLFGCSKDNAESLYKPTSAPFVSQKYLVGNHPYLNSKKMYNSYRPILDYLESKMDGVFFELETSANYAQYNKKLFSEKFDFSLPNPYQTYNSFSHNYTAIAKMKPDSEFKGVFVARKDSHLKNPEQLIGKEVSFPAPTALAAAMMPLYFLEKHGINTKTQIIKKYVGSQYSSIFNAYTGDTIAGATWPTSWKSWVKENPIKAKEMEVAWETKILINNGFIANKRVDKKIAKRVAELLSNLDKTKEGKILLKNAGFAGFELANDRKYDVVKDFLDEYDKVIGLPK